jgi:hypothetical protein
MTEIPSVQRNARRCLHLTEPGLLYLTSAPLITALLRASHDFACSVAALVSVQLMRNMSLSGRQMLSRLISRVACIFSMRILGPLVSGLETQM